MSEDRRLLDALTAELTALGFRVFCASDFEELADLVRSGLDRLAQGADAGAGTCTRAESHTARPARIACCIEIFHRSEEGAV